MMIPQRIVLRNSSSSFRETESQCCSFYLTSEQLFAPAGSLKQDDMAITAASIDASSPCLI